MCPARTTPTPTPHISKYERIKQFLKRFPAEVVDPQAMEAYAAVMGTADEFMNEGLRRLAPHGLADARAHILAILLHHEPAELTHSELAERLGVTKGNITGLIDGLEHSGYVKRGTRDEDRRVVPISLTPAGRRLTEKVLREHFVGIADLIHVLSAAEQKQLVHLLTKLGNQLAAARNAS